MYTTPCSVNVCRQKRVWRNLRAVSPPLLHLLPRGISATSGTMEYPVAVALPPPHRRWHPLLSDPSKQTTHNAGDYTPPQFRRVLYLPAPREGPQQMGSLTYILPPRSGPYPWKIPHTHAPCLSNPRARMGSEVNAWTVWQSPVSKCHHIR